MQQLEDRLLKAKEDSAGLPPSGRDLAIRDLASAKEKLLKAEVGFVTFLWGLKHFAFAFLLMKQE